MYFITQPAGQHNQLSGVMISVSRLCRIMKSNNNESLAESCSNHAAKAWKINSLIICSEQLNFIFLFIRSTSWKYLENHSAAYEPIRGKLDQEERRSGTNSCTTIIPSRNMSNGPYYPRHLFTEPISQPTLSQMPISEDNNILSALRYVVWDKLAGDPSSGKYRVSNSSMGKRKSLEIAANTKSWLLRHDPRKCRRKLSDYHRTKIDILKLF